MTDLKATKTTARPASTMPNQFYAMLIAENSVDSIAVLDSEAKTEWVNAAFVEHTGYSFEECVGQSPAKYLIGPETDRATLRKIANARKRNEPIHVELKLYKKSGDPYWAELRQTPIRGDGDAVTHVLSASRDITAQKALERERELARQNELLRQAERRVLAKTTEWLYAARSLEDLFNVVETCAPKLLPRTSGALYIYSNSRDILDLATSWGTQPPAEYIEPDECWALRRGRAYHYGDGEIEFPCGHFDEAVSSSFCLPLLAHGETIGMLWCHSERDARYAELKHGRFWDVSLMLAEQVSLTIANVRLRQELEDRSIKDPLTGLWNRRYFLDSLRREAARANGSSIGFSLISIDVDNFKRFNDHHGHDAGDLVLRRVSNELVSAAGANGTVCRVGGEELAVICRALQGESALIFANRLREAVKRMEIVYQGEVLPSVTVSARIPQYPSNHTSIDALMRVADSALYQAKRAGRDRVISFENDDKDRQLGESPEIRVATAN